MITMLGRDGASYGSEEGRCYGDDGKPVHIYSSEMGLSLTIGKEYAIQGHRL